MSLQRRAAILLAVLVGALLLSNIIRATIQFQRDAAGAQAQSAQLLETEEKEFVVGMINQETGLRGYEQTGQSQYLEPYQLGISEVKVAGANLDSTATSRSTRAKVAAMETAAGKWQAHAGSRVVAVASSGPSSDPSALAEGKRLFDAFRMAESDLGTSLEGEVMNDLTLATNLARATAIASLVGTVTVLVVIIFLAVIVFRSTLRPVQKLVLAANALALGDAVTIPSLSRSDEIGQLANSLSAWELAARERLNLAQAMVDVGARTELNELMELGLGHTADTLAAAEVAASLDSGLVFMFSAGESRRIESAVGALLPEHTPAAEVMRTGQPLIGNVRDHVWPAVIQDWAARNDLGPMVTVPMVSGGMTVGTLTAVRHTGAKGFGPADLARAQLIVVPLAAAIRVARLFEDVRHTNAELLEANRHKSIFLANMSHELRTPLNAILGFSELLIEDAAGRFDTVNRDRFLKQIHTSGKHLLGLINDILDLSKVEAGHMELEPQNVIIGESVQGVAATVEPLLQTKNLTLRIQVDPGIQVVADPGKLKQMLLNLVSNAIKFTPVGGQVTIRARRVDAWVEIAVIDTGVGIAEEDLGRLFSEFQQLDAGPGLLPEGTGLGLALTKRFAELHGGTVEVESVKGEGSTFVIRLPVEGRKATEPQAIEPAQIETEDPNRPLVLVVDDNADAAELLVRHLEAGEFRTKIARTGLEALAMARDLKPVAITLDILMPEIDGWEVLTQLKADEATRDIPVVMVSVVDNPALGRALGALDFFVKPVDRVALLSRLGRYTFTTKAKHGEIRVLVIDDEAVNVDFLEALLVPAGFTVLRAAGGKEGIEIARSQRPELILLDLIMPDVTGFEVVETLRSDDGTRSIPIMVLTSKELSEDDKRALNGHVAGIFGRNSVAGHEIVAWLRSLMTTPRGPGGAIPS